VSQVLHVYFTHLNKVSGNWRCFLAEQINSDSLHPPTRIFTEQFICWPNLENQLFVCRLSTACRVNTIPVNRQTPRFLAGTRGKLSKLIRPTFMRHLPKGRLGGGRARVSHPRAQQGSCRVQRRRRRLPAPRCRSARRVFRSAVTFGDAAATATSSARTKVQAQPTAADRATAASAAAAAAAAAVSTAATSGHANTVLKSFGMARSASPPLRSAFN